MKNSQKVLVVVGSKSLPKQGSSKLSPFGLGILRLKVKIYTPTNEFPFIQLSLALKLAYKQVKKEGSSKLSSYGTN